MRTLLVFVVVLVGTAAVATSSGGSSLTYSSTAPSGDAIGHARLHEIDQSGIQGRIFFVDNGTTLFVLGAATGLTPGQTYRSLVYGEGSHPGGPEACEPSTTQPRLGFLKMFVGTWTVNSDGTGTLVAAKTGPSYVPVSNAGTISIRHVVGPPPAILQACGEVAVNPQ